MDESLMEQRRVNEEGLRVVKFCCQRRMCVRVTVHVLTVSDQKATANYVPAAAVYVGGKRCPDLLGVKGTQAVF